MVDQGIVRVRARIADQPLCFLRRWRTTQQIQINSTDQRVGVRLGRGVKPLSIELTHDIQVDRIPRPLRLADLGQNGTLWRHEGPMFCIDRTLFDPAPEILFLLDSEARIMFGRRHLLRFILRFNSSQHLAVVRRPRRKGSRLDRRRSEVQTQVCLSLLLVGAMTRKTTFRQHWADIAVKIHGELLAMCFDNIQTDGGDHPCQPKSDGRLGIFPFRLHRSSIFHLGISGLKGSATLDGSLISCRDQFVRSTLRYPDLKPNGP